MPMPDPSSGSSPSPSPTPTPEPESTPSPTTTPASQIITSNSSLTLNGGTALLRGFPDWEYGVNLVVGSQGGTLGVTASRDASPYEMVRR